MYKRCVKAITVLAVLLISLISISSAASLHASSDLYKGQCGVELSVPAPGILRNDVQNPSLVNVVNPELITIDPKYGIITVNADGSFVYDVPEDIGTSATVTFTYTITDGNTVSNSATVKILVSCRCHAAAPDVTACLGTQVGTEFLMSEGAGCFGCDSTGTIDVSQIPADPVAGETYTYTVSCPGCTILTGHVTFEGACIIESVPFTVCEGIVPTSELILANGVVTCSCDESPVISDIHMVDDHWEYTITCQSECGPTTATGVVNIDTPCVPTWEPFSVCEGTDVTAALIIANAQVSCGSGVCDTTPVISDITEVADGFDYTITCTSADGCVSTATGHVDVDAACEPTWNLFTVCEETEVTEALILANAEISCGTGVCDATPVISDITEVADGFDYTITCTSADGCVSTATGHVDICVISFIGFDVQCDQPPLSLTPADIIELGMVECVGCTDNTPVITDVRFVELVNPGAEDEYELWAYTITCNGCTATGQFNNFCLSGCVCAPQAPNVCGCTANPFFPLAQFHDRDGGCYASAGCDVTEIIDDSGVDYSTPGIYTYTVICSGCNYETRTKDGLIKVVNPVDGLCEDHC